MGFTVPLNEWFQSELKDFIGDVFQTALSRQRPYMNVDAILGGLGNVSGFSRKIWALLSLELWHQLFHDEEASWKSRATENCVH
jgi:asparagine synthase (glutamine-hydrolysing)